MLADRVASFFGGGARQRGTQYFKAGRARIEAWSDDDSIAVRVRGTREYDVRLEIAAGKTGWTVAVDCTCPYVDSCDDYCKHIWAAILAVDADGRLESPPARVDVHFLASDGEEREADDDPVDVVHAIMASGVALGPRSIARQGIARQAVERWRRFRSGRPAVSVRPHVPDWTELVNLVKPAASLARPLARARPVVVPEPWYVIEGDDSNGSGSVTVSLASRTVLKSGEPGALRQFSIHSADIGQISDPRHRMALLLLSGAIPSSERWYYRSWAADDRSAQHTWQIPLAAAAEILPRLFETGRVLFRSASRDLPIPLAWDGGDPWDFVIGFEPDAKGYRLVGTFRRGEERIPLATVRRLYDGEPALIVHDSTLRLVRTHGAPGWMRTLHSLGPCRVAARDRAAFLAGLETLAAFPPVEWPSDWGISHETGVVPRPVLNLTRKSRSYYVKRDQTYAHIEFRYGERSVMPGRPGAWLIDPSAGRLIERHIEDERRLYNRLFELGMKVLGYSGELAVADKRVPALVAALLGDGWEVHGEKGMFRWGGTVSIDATTGIDWFEVEGRVDFDGVGVSLPEVLAAARRGEQFVRLDDGSMGMLPAEWLRRHGALLELGRVEDGRVRFSRAQVGLIDVLLEQLPEASFDAALAKARQKLASFEGIPACEPPDGFVGELREYQKEGLGWMRFLSEFGWGGCLADDMGLGKTIQVLALLLERKRRGQAGPSLVVVPKSVLFNWVREAARFTPDLKVIAYAGSDRRRLESELDAADLIVTTYGTLRADIARLREREFAYAILDEAQAIKNPASQSAKAARLLRASHRLVMTGTPIENRLGDLWSLFEFLNPGMLGAREAFESAFDRRGGNGQHDTSEPRVALARMLRPFILRRTKERVAPELPARIEQTIECDLAGAQAETYRKLRDYYRARVLGKVDEVGMDKARIYVLEALLRLRQAACHPGLIDRTRADGESAKLESLLPMVEEVIAEGHKALIFSQFTSFLAILRKRLDALDIAYEYLDGKTHDRKARCDRFQTDPSCPLFLISLKAGGVGLNLTAADYVFILDPWWNPAVEAQAIDRTHRIGQTRRVIAYRIIARDTVESKILQLQDRKRDLAAAVINESNSVVRDLTRDDLALLLS